MERAQCTIRYRSGPRTGGAVIVEDARGDLYACTDAGPFARIPRLRLDPLLAHGWVAVAGDAPQPLDTILRALAPAR